MFGVEGGCDGVLIVGLLEGDLGGDGNVIMVLYICECFKNYRIVDICDG